MVRRFWWFSLVFVVMFLLGLMAIFTLNYGKIECNTFVNIENDKKAECGLTVFPRVLMNEKQYNKYVGYFKLEDIVYTNNNLFLIGRIPINSLFSYKVRFILPQRDDGKYEISGEKLKRWGYFDNDKLILFSADEVNNIKKDYIGREMMVSFLVGGGEKEDIEWREFIGKKDWLKMYWFMLKGLFNLNNLDVHQAGV